mmetsp:Transcript_34182/g.45186  ORF Transcript_34182/g.45186 Transcript_34182/m.45186 type:complete len:216 (-) Transcript_34182:96-743(-)
MFGGDGKGDPNKWTEETHVNENLPSRSAENQPKGEGENRPLLTKKQVKRGCVLMMFLFINLITVLSALSVATGQVLSIIEGNLSFQEIGIRVYGFVFCLAIVLFEMEWTKPIRDMIIVQNWVLRGVLYAFVGLLGLEEESEPSVSDGSNNNYARDYIELTAYIIIGVGFLYVLMGLCCLKQVRDNKMSKYRTLMAHADVEEARARSAAGEKTIAV